MNDPEIFTEDVERLEFCLRQVADRDFSPVLELHEQARPHVNRIDLDTIRVVSSLR